MHYKTISPLVFLILFTVGCASVTTTERKVKNSTSTNYDASYFSGEAEISTYTLEKARYDSIHPGEAILIFVTEPFLPQKQVKADDYKQENTQVLKLNRIDRFTTGIYDYSQFTSVFTPLENYDPRYPLKITMGSQDWCGQSFMQLNNNNGFDILLRSYFESEGDESVHIDYAITEDNLFNLIRIDETLLPTGEFEIIPSFAFKRNVHAKENKYEAKGTLNLSADTLIYTYKIPALKRTVEIHFDSENKNQITTWKETYPTVFDQKLRTSKYVLKKTRHTPYWEKNNAADIIYRDSLGLSR